MISIPQQSETISLCTDQAMDADFVTTHFECGGWDLGGMVIAWTGANSTKALFIPQFSIDKIYWCNYVSEATAEKADAASGCKMYEFEEFAFPYLRLKFLKKSNSAGQLTAKVYAKRQWGYNR